MGQLKILHVIAGSERGGAETFCLGAMFTPGEAGVKQCVADRPYPPLVNAVTKAGVPFKGVRFNFVQNGSAQYEDTV